MPHGEAPDLPVRYAVLMHNRSFPTSSTPPYPPLILLRNTTFAVCSYVVDRNDFYGRFSTSSKDREEGILPQAKSLYRRHKTPWVLPLMLVLAFNLVFGVVRPFVAEPMRVPSKSMAPTLKPKDRMLTNKLAYDLTNPDRGDLVVFRSVEKGKKERLVKRAVGLPGDVVHVDRGVLKVNGEPQNEPYVSKAKGSKKRDGARKAPPGVNTFGPMLVPEDHVFVMGDNRAHSHDSRYFGPVPRENLIGEASLRFWPLDRIGTP